MGVEKHAEKKNVPQVGGYIPFAVLNNIVYNEKIITQNPQKDLSSKIWK